MNKTVPALVAAGLAALILSGCNSGGGGSAPVAAQGPNILFVIMDDVGIDQMKVFGYGGINDPVGLPDEGRGIGADLPNIDAVARAGVRFRNTWSMPECSPGRAAFFVGRFPLRTGINQAIGPQDLATSQLSPYDITTPKLLKRANYESAMFGKFHLAGPENNEAENATPSTLGWDYFYGWVGGLPGSIDTWAGEPYPGPDPTPGPYVCGFAPAVAAGGEEKGACYKPDGSCDVIARKLVPREDAAPGLQCLDSGGILVSTATCGAAPGLDFTRLNAYYVSPLVIINNGDMEIVPVTDARARGYRTRIETDAAIDWIKSRPADRAWMATVSYSAAHTPWQQPPMDLLQGHVGPLDHLRCSGNAIHTRLIQDRMTEAMDSEFGRLLVETGLAKRNVDESLNYDPKATNTVIVIVGDNGTLATAVKIPFDPSRAKGTAYQTGVWDPLIIAGPQVAQPDREVDHMVNTVDLFQFFGELAGLDVHKEVPRTVDSVGILPYLTDPGQGSLRTINFTMGGLNQQANGGRNGPCVIDEAACTVIPTSKSVCEDNEGVWWGAEYTDPLVIPAPDPAKGYPSCAAVNEALYNHGRAVTNLVPESSVAVRNDRYKLVRNISVDYVSAGHTADPLYVADPTRYVSKTTNELFEINQAVPTPLLDTDTRDLMLPPGPDTEAVAVFDELTAKLDHILASNPDCPGDGNMDGVVNAEDLSNWARIANDWGLSSVYDFVSATTGGFRDGNTDHHDEAIIQPKLNTTCDPTYAVY